MKSVLESNANSVVGRRVKRRQFLVQKEIIIRCPVCSWSPKKRDFTLKIDNSLIVKAYFVGKSGINP